SDPVRALETFRRMPYHGLVVDAGTVGEEGLLVFDQVMAEAVSRSVPCAGVLLLNADQADWQGRVTDPPHARRLGRPAGGARTLRQLHRKLTELMGEPV